MSTEPPTEAEVKQAYDIVTRMVRVAHGERQDDQVDFDDWCGLVEGKRQIIRYATRHFPGAYERFTKDE